jgi:hypothetical protein
MDRTPSQSILLIRCGPSPADLLKNSIRNPRLADQSAHPRPLNAPALTAPRATISNPDTSVAQPQPPAPPSQPTGASAAAPNRNGFFGSLNECGLESGRILADCVCQ